MSSIRGGVTVACFDTSEPNNLKIFQDQWKRGQPVMVSNSHEHLNMAQWTPESFSKDYGNDKIDSIDCLNGAHLSNEPMKFFWDGFNHIDKRMQDNEGKPMLLKLKDWPPAEDFADKLPIRFKDFMDSLPLPDYTQRSGNFNLAIHLAKRFNPPENFERASFFPLSKGFMTKDISIDINAH